VVSYKQIFGNRTGVNMNQPSDEEAQRLMEELENSARKLGLYADNLAIGVPMGGPNLDDEERMVVVGQFTIGDIAWSDRVQNPQADETDMEFRKMAVDLEKDAFEAKRLEIERKLKEGKPIFGDDDNKPGI
jgi:hypothetical protein